jgi:hypothetical protein
VTGIETMKGMATPTREHQASPLREKVREEFKLFSVVFVFLALMFGAFLTYRRLVPSESGVTYFHYGAGLIKAAVVAKIILLGQALKLGKRVESQPLIIVVLVKSVLYGLLVAVFNVLERVVEGLVRGYDWQATANLVVMNGWDEILAGALMVMVSFIPFFALWETGRVLGAGKLSEMFLHKRPA